MRQWQEVEAMLRQRRARALSLELRKPEKSNERPTQQFACLERERESIEPEQDETGRNRLTGFLEIRELRPGFFVFRFPRKRRSTHCDACGVETHYRR